MAPALVRHSRETCYDGAAGTAFRHVLQPGAPSAAEDAGLADGVTADRYARLEFMAGAAMLGFGMIYLVILCEFALGACFAGTAFTRAMVMRLLIPGAVFTFAVVLGLVLTRSKTQQQRSGGGHP